GAGTQPGIEVSEEPLLGVAARGAGGDRCGLVSRRALDDVAHALAGHQRQRVDEGEVPDAVARQLGRTADNHAARARADEHDALEILVEHDLRDLLPVGARGDSRAYEMVALGAAVETRRVHPMPGRPQAVDDGLPDPAALIRAVNEDVRGHGRSLMLRRRRPAVYTVGALCDTRGARRTAKGEGYEADGKGRDGDRRGRGGGGGRGHELVGRGGPGRAASGS